MDYFITSNPTLVNNIEIHPGIADHDAVLVSANIKPYESKQIPRSVPFYKKTNWDGFKLYIRSFCIEILANHTNKDVEQIWSSLKTAIETGISQFVPIKKIGSKRSMPWITQEIKRLIRKRDSLFQKQKKGHPRDRRHFKEVKHLVQTKIKSAYNNYLQSIQGLSNEEGATTTDSDQQNFAPKKLFSLIKNAKQDAHGVSPLKDKVSGTTFSQSKDKATLLNKQFQSVFSQLSPLKLLQLCIDKLQDYFSVRIPQQFQCNYPKMPEFNIDQNGILKLLSKLKPDKAAGPDGIKPIGLKELREEITPVIQLLFQKSLSTDNIPTDWKKANVSPVFKKGTKSDPSNYRPIS